VNAGKKTAIQLPAGAGAFCNWLSYRNRVWGALSVLYCHPSDCTRHLVPGVHVEHCWYFS